MHRYRAWSGKRLSKVGASKSRSVSLLGFLVQYAPSLQALVAVLRMASTHEHKDLVVGVIRVAALLWMNDFPWSSRNQLAELVDTLLKNSVRVNACECMNRCVCVCKSVTTCNLQCMYGGGNVL